MNSRESRRLAMIVGFIAVLLVGICAACPNIIEVLASRDAMIAFVFMIVISALLVAGIRQVARAVLGDLSGPWYLEEGSGWILFGGLVLAGAITTIVGVNAFNMLHVAIPLAVIVFAAVAFVLTLIVRIDWPSGTLRPRHRNDDDDDSDEDDDDISVRD